MDPNTQENISTRKSSNPSCILWRLSSDQLFLLLPYCKKQMRTLGEIWLIARPKHINIPSFQLTYNLKQNSWNTYCKTIRNEGVLKWCRQQHPYPFPIFIRILETLRKAAVGFSIAWKVVCAHGEGQEHSNTSEFFNR